MHCQHAQDVIPPAVIAAKPASARLVGLLVALPCLAVLVTAFLLAPEHGGMGTHRQLHLYPCSFLANTGWPCPSCGMTTAFAAVVHGQGLLAVQAQAFGALLAVLMAALAATAGAQLATGRNVLRYVRPRLWWLWPGAALTLAGWGIKAWWGWSIGVFPLR